MALYIVFLVSFVSCFYRLILAGPVLENSGV